MRSAYTDAILSQMSKAGKDRTTTTETTQQQPVEPIDLGQLALVLAMLLGKSKPATEPITDISEPDMAEAGSVYNQPQLQLSGPPPMGPYAAGFGTYTPGYQDQPYNTVSIDQILGSLGSTPITPWYL